MVICLSMKQILSIINVIMQCNLTNQTSTLPFLPLPFFSLPFLSLFPNGSSIYLSIFVMCAIPRLFVLRNTKPQRRKNPGENLARIFFKTDVSTLLLISSKGILFAELLINDF